MYCSKCGTKLPNDSKFCSECGTPLNTVIKNDTKEESELSFVWGILGFMIPLAGLILYLCWKVEKPSDAKAAGIGALIRVVLYVMLTIITILLSLGIMTIY